MIATTLSRLRNAGIQPSIQRLAVAEYILNTDRHPSAERIWNRVRRSCPTLSRATVYNTLNLMVERGLVRPLVLAEGKVVFDPRVDAHHHFIDVETGRIYDIPWETLKVSDIETMPDYDVREYQVVLRGTRKKKR